MFWIQQVAIIRSINHNVAALKELSCQQNNTQILLTLVHTLYVNFIKKLLIQTLTRDWSVRVLHSCFSIQALGRTLELISVETAEGVILLGRNQTQNNIHSLGPQVVPVTSQTELDVLKGRIASTKSEIRREKGIASTHSPDTSPSSKVGVDKLFMCIEKYETRARRQ